MSERIFLRLGDRLALGADPLQWILYKSKAKAGSPSLEPKHWIAISFVHSTKHILERCIRESGLRDATAASALESLHSPSTRGKPLEPLRRHYPLPRGGFAPRRFKRSARKPTRSAGVRIP